MAGVSTWYVLNELSPSSPQNLYIDFSFESQNFSGDNCVSLYVNASWNGNTAFNVSSDSNPFSGLEMVFVGANTSSMEKNLSSLQHNVELRYGMNPALNASQAFFPEAYIGFSVSSSHRNYLARWNETYAMQSNGSLTYQREPWSGYYTFHSITVAVNGNNIGDIIETVNYPYIYISI